MEAHLAECSGCQHRLKRRRSVVEQLQRVQPARPPDFLTHQVRRRVASRSWAAWRARTGTRQLGATGFPPGPLGLGFALVVALATILLLFAVATHQKRATSVVVAPSAAYDPLPERLELGGRRFERSSPGWREEGVDERARPLPASSPEGRRIMGENPWLEQLLSSEAAVRFRSEGEVLEIRRE